MLPLSVVGWPQRAAAHLIVGSAVYRSVNYSKLLPGPLERTFDRIIGMRWTAGTDGRELRVLPPVRQRDHAMIPDTSFSPETVTLMGRVCDAAWREVQEKLFFPSQWEAEAFRRELAERVMAAVAGGERNATRLKVIALESMEA